MTYETKVTIGVTVQEDDVRRFLGCSDDYEITDGDVESYIDDEYNVGNGCEIEIL